MSTANDMTVLASRIRKATADGEAWKAAGSQERYLEAFFLAEGLEAEMQECMKHEHPSAIPSPTQSGSGHYP
jgi:hypothetical protein